MTKTECLVKPTSEIEIGGNPPLDTNQWYLLVTTKINDIESHFLYLPNESKGKYNRNAQIFSIAVKKSTLETYFITKEKNREIQINDILENKNITY